MEEILKIIIIIKKSSGYKIKNQRAKRTISGGEKLGSIEVDV